MPEIRKPALGRPADSRLTAEFIASDPRFAGVSPFDPAVDVDIVDEMNAALNEVGNGSNPLADFQSLQLTPAQNDTYSGLGGVIKGEGGIIRLGFISIVSDSASNSS